MGRAEIATRREGGGGGRGRGAGGEELQIKPNGSRDENGGRSPPSPVPFDSPHFLLSFWSMAFSRAKTFAHPQKKKRLPALQAT